MSDELVPVEARAGLAIDLAYATPRTPVGYPVYAPGARCVLRPEAATRLARAAAVAAAAELELVVWDSYRPEAVQRIFWHALPDPRYIADPTIGSNHTRGVAVDLGLREAGGDFLDMGTGFDDMRVLSHHDCAQLSPAVQRNRCLLLGIMLHAGFASLPTEWWHYELPDARRHALIPSAAAIQALPERVAAAD